MQTAEIAQIVAYISNYLLAFIVSMLGAFSNDAMIALKKQRKMNLLRIIIPSIFSAFLLCALEDYFNVSFQIYMFICFFFGMWSFNLLKVCTNSKIILIFAKNLFKILKDPISKSVSETIVEMEKDDKKEVENKDKKDSSSSG